MTPQPVIYTVKATNEYGHAIYYQTGSPSEAWKVFVRWRTRQINHQMRNVRVEPAVPVIGDDEPVQPGQLYLERHEGRTFSLKVSGWNVVAVIRKVRSHCCSIDVWDDFFEETRFTATCHLNLPLTIEVAATALRGLAKMDGVAIYDGIIYRENTLSEAF